MSANTVHYFALLVIVSLSVPVARADGNSNEQQSVQQPQRPERVLPGEEVITTTGKKVKVWSTKGPVEVSRPAEPFEDREKSVLDSTVIELEADAPYRPRRVPDVEPGPQFDPRYRERR